MLAQPAATAGTVGVVRIMKLSNNKQLGLGAAAALALAIGLIILIGPAPVRDPIVSVPAQTVAAPVKTDAAQPAPVLDTFRVEPDGVTVMAGRATPLAMVDIMLNGTSIATATADANGAFVAFPVLDYADTSRAISLVENPQATAVASLETYLVAPLPAPATTENSDEDAPPLTAPAIIVASEAGLRIVHSNSDTAPEVLSSVALDTITYDPSGEVLIAGRASGVGSVQIYIDNQPVTTSRITQNGNWRTDLPQIDTGVYTLRVDELDTTGEVISRIETPFQREEPQVVAQALAEQTQADNFQVAMTTVQPGTTLWAIAEQRYGDGIQYFKVFEANRDRIRDPDLIYPGQVFRIPEGDQ
tara:strand:- start:35297 stop:36373 length:1077 start_codon:yes stop_codon:yes gene_type:complete